jgi:hypothetical protein
MNVICEGFVVELDGAYKLGQNTSVPKIYTYRSAAASTAEQGKLRYANSCVKRCYVVVLDEEEQDENTSNT